MEELAASGITQDLVEVSNDNSGKDTESNGKKVLVISGLIPITTGTNNKSPKPQRERKKSKSKSGEEKSADEGEKVEKSEGSPVPKIPSKADCAGDSKSPGKKSPEKISKSPKKSVGEEEPNTV